MWWLGTTSLTHTHTHTHTHSNHHRHRKKKPTRATDQPTLHIKGKRPSRQTKILDNFWRCGVVRGWGPLPLHTLGSFLHTILQTCTRAFCADGRTHVQDSHPSHLQCCPHRRRWGLASRASSSTAETNENVTRNLWAREQIRFPPRGGPRRTYITLSPQAGFTVGA